MAAAGGIAAVLQDEWPAYAEGVMPVTEVAAVESEAMWLLVASMEQYLPLLANTQVSERVTGDVQRRAGQLLSHRDSYRAAATAWAGRRDLVLADDAPAATSGGRSVPVLPLPHEYREMHAGGEPSPRTLVGQSALRVQRLLSSAGVRTYPGANLPLRYLQLAMEAHRDLHVPSRCRRLVQALQS